MATINPKVFFFSYPLPSSPLRHQELTKDKEVRNYLLAQL